MVSKGSGEVEAVRQHLARAQELIARQEVILASLQRLRSAERAVDHARELLEYLHETASLTEDHVQRLLVLGSNRAQYPE